MEKIYLDANVFLFPLITKSAEAKHARIILDQLVRGNIQACTSALTWDEVSYKCLKHLSQEDALQAIDVFMRLRNLEVISVDAQVIRKSYEFLSQGLLPRDAIHAACAQIAGCEMIISDDKDFDRISLKRISLQKAEGFLVDV